VSVDPPTKRPRGRPRKATAEFETPLFDAVRAADPPAPTTPSASPPASGAAPTIEFPAPTIPCAAPQTLVVGDARRLPELADGSVSLVVTSPPYWTLKDYGPEGQVGFGQTLEEYGADLGRVFAECARALAPGCRLCVNIGDQFVRAATHGRYRVVPLHAEILRRVEALGLDFMGSIIWRKATTCNPSGGAAVMGSFPFPRNGVVKLDYEHVLLFKKPGVAPKPDRARKERDRMTVEEWNAWFAGHWSFPGERARGHLAPFPLELPRRLIRMFTFEGETVLDPFCGSGTTLEAAYRLGRRGVGVDLDPGCAPYVEERFAVLGGEASRALTVVRRSGDAAAALSAAVSAPTSEATVRAADPTPTATPPDTPFYGSIVRRSDRGRTRFPGTPVRLQRVLGPAAFETTCGREVRLLGVLPIPERATAAADRLETLARGKPLLLTGPDGADPADGAPAYVHAADRTFLNGRLLREGLLAPDPAAEHPRARAFRRWAEQG